MAYTTIDDPTAHFQTKLYTGTGSSLAITGVGFQPDWIWFKSRSQAQSHAIVDSVRGREGLQSNTSDEAYTLASGKDFGTFDSDGFTVLTPQQLNSFNYNTGSIVAWNWKAGTAFSNDASSTSVGSIDSAGSVNTTAGFSIITYTGTGSAGTIAHGLGAVPGWYVIKRRNSSEHWQVYHENNTSAPGTDYLQLSTAEATVDAATRWNDTVPTSTVFSVGAHASVNADASTYVAYCFAEKKGYSKFGTYTGSGNADGPFAYTGFKPAFVLIKQTTDGSTPWFIFDTKRNPGNSADLKLNPDDAAAESAANEIEILSNGFKVSTSGSYNNGSGKNMIYMAFAESPFVTSKGVPTTAR